MSADFWAGYLSGAASIIIGNPLDLIKVRLQAKSSAPTTANVAEETSLRGISSPRTLLRGLPAPVLTYGALNALLFTTYNRSLSFLDPLPLSTAENSSTKQPHAAWALFTAGAVAGLATFVISAPTELVKCRAQVLSSLHDSPASAAPGKAPSSWAIARDTFRTSGIRGLYHGGAITSIRDGMGYGFYFFTYAACTQAWEAQATKNNPSGTPSSRVVSWDNGTAKVLLCGGLAGVATWASIFPLDVIKTRVQTQVQAVAPSFAATNISVAPQMTGEQSALLRPQTVVAQPPTTQRPLGAFAIAKQAYRNEGFHVFFRGLTVCCARAFIVNAVQWSVYESVMRYLSPANASASEP